MTNIPQKIRPTKWDKPFKEARREAIEKTKHNNRLCTQIKRMIGGADSFLRLNAHIPQLMPGSDTLRLYKPEFGHIREIEDVGIIFILSKDLEDVIICDLNIQLKDEI